MSIEKLLKNFEALPLILESENAQIISNPFQSSVFFKIHQLKSFKTKLESRDHVTAISESKKIYRNSKKTLGSYIETFGI
jgi:hypothetical protein